MLVYKIKPAKVSFRHPVEMWLSLVCLLNMGKTPAEACAGDCPKKKGSAMKIVKEAAEKTGEDLYTEKYEFRACGGSIEPEDKVEKLKEDRTDEESDR